MPYTGMPQGLSGRKIGTKAESFQHHPRFTKNLISKDYKDKDCLRYVKRLKREGNSLFIFIMSDVEYHNNVSERALRRFAEFRKILYGNRFDAGARRTKILMSVYATCEQRGVNFY